MATRYKAGEEVDSKCTKCKLVLAHVIVAMNGSKIAKVKCNTCGGTHAYRPPPTASEATAARRRAERKAAAAEAEKTRTSAAEFEAIAQSVDLSKPERYSVKAPLQIKAVIDHPKFGVGVVTELREDNKAHVAFSDGGRILVHSR